MIEVDIEKALSLIHDPDSITYGEELSRRIDSYLKLRIRDMDYLLDEIRYEGLNRDAYQLFSNELKNLPRRDSI